MDVPNSNKAPLTIGLLAHVDAGKTTLSEALLYVSGAKRTLGRVDHRDAYLDTHDLERARGITIFSKQAILETSSRHITLVDTPGHVDFSAEAERVISILDCAVLVISSTDGIQAIP
jgi:small GTP-binding protein